MNIFFSWMMGSMLLLFFMMTIVCGNIPCIYYMLYCIRYTPSMKCVVFASDTMEVEAINTNDIFSSNNNADDDDHVVFVVADDDDDDETVYDDNRMLIILLNEVLPYGSVLFLVEQIYMFTKHEN